jgi:hypothetical protein
VFAQHFSCSQNMGPKLRSVMVVVTMRYGGGDGDASGVDCDGCYNVDFGCGHFSSSGFWNQSSSNTFHLSVQ